MPSLKEVRGRIVSVSSTMQITSAMKMVSAAKLRRAQDAIIQLRPYANKLRDMLSNVSASVEESADNAFSRTGEVRNVLIIAVSSNRGLAGAFNANVIKQVNRLINGEYAGKNVQVIGIGKKANDAFRRTANYYTAGRSAVEYNSLFDGLSFDRVAPVVEEFMSSFVSGNFDRVVIVYNQFRNAAVQVVQTEQLMPMVPASSDSKASRTEYIFEPSQEYIVKELIPKSIKIQFYKALLDSFASEHGARMTAMHKATDNGRELLRDLKITYNKARQAAITKEILEIVGGAEALNA